MAYQISSKTGLRHVVEADMPARDEVLKMFRGTSLPTARCGKALQVVNFYEPNEPSLLRYQCGRCFAPKKEKEDSNT
jgi:hypothetical protein